MNSVVRRERPNGTFANRGYSQSPSIPPIEGDSSRQSANFPSRHDRQGEVVARRQRSTQGRQHRQGDQHRKQKDDHQQGESVLMALLFAFRVLADQVASGFGFISGRVAIFHLLFGRAAGSTAPRPRAQQCVSHTLLLNFRPAACQRGCSGRGERKQTENEAVPADRLRKTACERPLPPLRALLKYVILNGSQCGPLRRRAGRSG